MMVDWKFESPRRRWRCHLSRSLRSPFNPSEAEAHLEMRRRPRVPALPCIDPDRASSNRASLPVLYPPEHLREGHAQEVDVDRLGDQ